MTGELFIKTSRTGGWYDAYTRWGLSLEDGALSRLMTPPPHKEPVSNKNVMMDGISVVQDQFFADVRSVSLEMHIVAPRKDVFWARYASFCTEVLNEGYIDLVTRYEPTKVYHFLYSDCTQFTEFQETMAKFTLSLNEPNPSVHSGSVPFVTDGEGNVVTWDDNTPMIPDNAHLRATIDEINELLAGGSIDLVLEELTEQEIDAIIV